MSRILALLLMVFASFMQAHAAELRTEIVSLRHDTRTLIVAPQQVSEDRPITIVLYFHGNLDTETFEQVMNRQQIAEQVGAAGVNAVLIAPYLGFESPKGAWRFAARADYEKFLDEACLRLATLAGVSISRLKQARIVIVAYSGGHGAARHVLRHGSARVESVLMLDAAYNTQWIFAEKAKAIARARKGYFLHMCTKDTWKRHLEFVKLLDDAGVPYQTAMSERLVPGTIVASMDETAEHFDFATRAWIEEPIRDFLRKAYGLEPALQ